MTGKRTRRRTNAVMGNLMFAPTVAAMRLPLLTLEAQRVGELPAEAMRATVEKAEAFAEGLAAAQMAYATAMWSFWPEVMSGRKPSLLTASTFEKAAAAALRPSGRRVRSNLRRLTPK